MLWFLFFSVLMHGAAVIWQGQDLEVNMANWIETCLHSYHEKTKLSFLYESCIFPSDSSAQQLVGNAVDHSQGL